MKSLAHRLIIGVGFVFAQPAASDGTGGWNCQGVLPAWTLKMNASQGVLMTNKSVSMPVMNVTRAEGRDWPQAFTLVGDRDTAIVIITPRACLLNETDFDTHVQVLTQQDNQPILLDGCCVKEPSK